MFEPKTAAAIVLFARSRRSSGRMTKTLARLQASEDGDEGRHDASNAPLVEGRQREAVFRDLVPRDRGDEVARDDEEDVDPDVAAARAP